MSAPIIRGSPEEVSVTAQFTDLNPTHNYRLGVGSTEKIQGLKIELLKDNNVVSRPLTEFQQGHANHWWGISSVHAHGFALQGEDLNPPGTTYTLRISIPRAEANRLGKIYLLVSRRYSPELWYLEDGTELSRGHW